MAFHHSIARLAVLVAALAAPGCQLIEPAKTPGNPLLPLTAAGDNVALEIFFARFAATDTALSSAIWSQIDEQAVPAATRRELAVNGLRAGVVGSQVPVELARLLTLTDQPPARDQENTVNLEAEPAVNLRLLSVRPGQRSEIVASNTYEELPLLIREGDQLGGKTYEKAECRFGLRATPTKDNRVLLDLLPELNYGEPQHRWTGADGAIRPEFTRPKRLFEELRLRAELAPGQMLVLSCRPERPGSLGHYYFTESKADAELQKILIIRLAQGGSDASFVEPTAPRDEALADEAQQP